MDIEKINEIKAQMDYERTRNSHPEGFPKLPEIPGKRYTDKNLYNLEIENIFLKSWLMIFREDEVISEAFAAQALSVSNELGLDSEKVNPNGSGISLGHPVGATGAIISVKALYELERIGGRFAIVTMCIGGGQGIAALFERVE